MPVYNEAGVIAEVLGDWVTELDRLGADFELRVYDDGSSDATPGILDTLATEDPRLVPIHQPNQGHGPSISRGYREARGEWVFQVDSDDELPTEGFAELWQRRGEFDLLMGWRRNRPASLGRRLVTAVSRLSVRWLFGSGIADVNTPYRLFRASELEKIRARVPAGAFAPNVILSGLAVRAGLRIFQCPVDFRVRREGPGSLTSARLIRGAARSFLELFTVAFTKAR